MNQIGLVLGEAGIGFDVASDGTTVLVPAGKTAQARMLLAEKGLPTSANAGYELFDNVGSLGLTSFMQQITRVRALEGEIARTIQSISGIRAARVHIVMSERANFRRDEQKPSASVVIRSSEMDAARSASSIRYLVAAAVPGLNAEEVTVLDSSGTLLAAGDDPNNTSVSRSLGVERTVETQIEDNIRRALAPYLGPDNFRASVKAEVNTDTRQTEETIFDPESRVERSVQIVRANENNSQQSAGTPGERRAEPARGRRRRRPSGPQSSEQSERKEETTNYEMNSKRIATVSNGYTVTKMSIAVVVNQQRLAAILGADATPEKIAERVSRNPEARFFGDRLQRDARRHDQRLGRRIHRRARRRGDRRARHLRLGRPACRHHDQRRRLHRRRLPRRVLRPEADGRRAWQAGCAGACRSELRGSAAFAARAGCRCRCRRAAGRRNRRRTPGSTPLDDLRQKLRPAPQDRLARMVDLNEERTAHILRKWAHQEEAA